MMKVVFGNWGIQLDLRCLFIQAGKRQLHGRRMVSVPKDTWSLFKA